jgi:putative ABC transport system permease protein
MRNLRHDVVHASRRLLRTPLYTVFAAVTLAIGIAATTSLYSLLYFVVWRPDAVVNPDRIVELKGDAVIPGRPGPSGRFSWPDWQSLREQQQSFTHVAAVGRLAVSVLNEGASSPALGEGVTGDYFAMVGVGPLYGRVLNPTDSAPDARLVVVLSARLARAQFRDEARAVGRTLKISGHIAEVIGVVTDNFSGIGNAFMPATFWLPLEHSRTMPGISDPYFDPARRDVRWLTVRGRLRDGTTLPKASEEVSLIGQRVEAAFPTVAVTQGPGKGTPAGRYWRADSANTRESDMFSSLGMAMMAGVGLVLLMVCTNLANLGLSRSAARKAEFAVRRALGASRWRLVREQLVECSLVVGLGAMFAAWATRWLITMMHVDVPISAGMTLTLEPEVTWPVVAMAAGASVLSMLLVGLGPAWRSTASDIRPLMAQDGATTPLRWRSQHRLVAYQVAGSVALLLLAVSMAQSVTHGTRSPGVDVDRLAVATVNFYLSPREAVQAARLRDDILQRVRQSPGVENVAASVGLPFGIYSGQGSVATSETGLAGNGGANAYLIAGTADLLPTLGIPLVSGRTFSEDEIRDYRPLIVVSETIARQVFGTTDAAGRSVWFKRGTPTKSAPEALTVVGVSQETDTFVMGMRPSGAVFLPFSQESRDQMVIVARTTGDTGALAGVLRRTIREVDPALVVDTAGSGWAVLSGRYFFLGALAWIASFLGALTLILVMTGLFGVLSALVTQQMREFGIRMALGSTPGELLRLVVRQGLRPARAGLILGLVLGVLSRFVLGAILPSGLAVVDVFAFIVVPLLIIVTTVASSIIPARRAARVDPNVALRQL